MILRKCLIRTKILLQAYNEQRPLTQLEQQLWPDMLQLAAFRFWVSRLDSKLFPLSGQSVLLKDPIETQKMLEARL